MSNWYQQTFAHYLSAETVSKQIVLDDHAFNHAPGPSHSDGGQPCGVDMQSIKMLIRRLWKFPETMERIQRDVERNEEIIKRIDEMLKEMGF